MSLNWIDSETGLRCDFFSPKDYFILLVILVFTFLIIYPILELIIN